LKSSVALHNESQIGTNHFPCSVSGGYSSTEEEPSGEVIGDDEDEDLITMNTIILTNEQATAIEGNKGSSIFGCHFNNPVQTIFDFVRQ